MENTISDLPNSKFFADIFNLPNYDHSIFNKIILWLSILFNFMQKN